MEISTFTVLSLLIQSPDSVFVLQNVRDVDIGMVQVVFFCFFANHVRL